MAASFKYWDDCVDPQDMEAMWKNPQVSNEWIDVGENKDQKVHLLRDPDGQPFLTQTEMKAVAEIVVHRHFTSEMDQDMICAIAELESDRQPLATRYDKKTKETTMGIMQMLPKTAEWLVSEMGYQAYEIGGNPELLHRPLINVYLGAAYLKWLSSYEGKDRTEEFVVRAYRRGPKKAASKTTLDYWRRYLSVKQNLPSIRKLRESYSSLPDTSPVVAVLQKTGEYWDSRTSFEDMEELWSNPDILQEWTKSGERRGKVRFSQDEKKRTYLSQLEVKAVAEIIVSKHFSSAKGVKATALAALAEVSTRRFVNGVGPRKGIMGIDYPKALWLYNDLGYRAYRVESDEDLFNPFVSMYFAAAYLVFLSQHEGKDITPQFVIQAYLGGPENGNHWHTFEEALSFYEDPKKIQGMCSIL